MNYETTNHDPKIQWWMENSPRMDYEDQKKVRGLLKYFDDLENTGKIGNTVMDIACGPVPISSILLHKNAARKTVHIDVMDVGYQTRDTRYIRYDIQRIGDANSYSTKKAVIAAAQHFGIDPRLGEAAHVDTAIFSEILNYVDYKMVLSNFGRYVKPGGRIIILNMPGRHPKASPGLLHPQGVKSTLELKKFLEKILKLNTWIFLGAVKKTLETRLGKIFL